MSTKNTLFNYFTKTPEAPSISKLNGSATTPSRPTSNDRHKDSPLNSEETQKSSRKRVRTKSPKKTPNDDEKQQETPKPLKKQCTSVESGSDSSTDKPKKSERKKRKNGLETPKPETDVKEQLSNLEDWSIGDLVWAKLDGYPWWPGIVNNEPSIDSHVDKKKGKVHVYFFDKPPTRSWIGLKALKKYSGYQSDNMKPKKNEQKWLLCCKEADECLTMSADERLMSTMFDEKPEIYGSEKELNEVINRICEKEAAKCRVNTLAMEVNNKKKLNFDETVEDDAEDNDDESLSDSTDEWSKHEEESSDNESEGEPEDTEQSEDISEIEESPVKKRPKGFSEVKPSPSVPKMSSPAVTSLSTPSRTMISPSTKLKLSAFAASNSEMEGHSAESDNDKWQHLQIDFLQPDKLKDGDKQLKNHPDYSPRTLFVPQSFKEKLTPAMRQWWDIKAKHFDTVLFFKVGKFYELYHMDAVTGVKELGLLFMKGEWAHSGFPEIAYDRNSIALIEKGYKVTRVEQTETPDMMNERLKLNKKSTKFDKVVKREVCQVSTKGTRVYSFIAGNPTKAESTFLMALTEKSDNKTQYGVCFIDTSIGTFHIGQFEDDIHCSRLRTLISHYPPSHVLYERGALSKKTLQLISSSLNNAIKEVLHPKTEFWTASKALAFLAEGEYFVENKFEWPEMLKGMLDQGDTLGLNADKGIVLGVSAFGAVIWYLKDCCLEQELLSRKDFKVYQPLDDMNEDDKQHVMGKHMVLDGVTLKNLDVIENSNTGTTDGTLLQRLDHCSTTFGKRLLRQWLCSPLCSVEGIKSRLDAVSDLMNKSDVSGDARKILKTIPDLERLLSKIHTQGSALRNKSHPDSRAVFYESQTYSKRKIQDLLSALEGFKEAKKIVDCFAGVTDELSSDLLHKCVRHNTQHEGNFPYMDEVLDFFDAAFDHEDAKKNGKIIPCSGVDSELDQLDDTIKQHDTSLKEYLSEQKKFFGCSVIFVGSDKKRYQIEVPDSASKKATGKYELQSQRKGYKRYYTPEGRDLLAERMEVEDKREKVLQDISRRIFSQFSEHHKLWNSAIDCLSILDVLLSFAAYVQTSEGDFCQPNVIAVNPQTRPYIKIRDGRHPCEIRTQCEQAFIPNDTLLGVCDGEASPSLILVTGPNMGGKSTLMRQVGLITIMAQLGCYVPASECELTVVDRVFTRLGASDDILSGQSTFFIELSETSSILSHATTNSLVLIDELGRGTSTFDGTAVAYSVVSELISIGCRTLFSTHYHSLVEDFKTCDNVALGHMACMVENDDENPKLENVTFLYKFSAGACPKSYGFNAARLAGMPSVIVDCAQRKSLEIEKAMHVRKAFNQIVNATKDKTLTRELVKYWINHADMVDNSHK